MQFATHEVIKMMTGRTVLIYGARTVAREVYYCLSRAPYNLGVISFVVSDRKGNPENIDEIPVIDVRHAAEKYKDALVIVAAMEKYKDSIEEVLLQNGFTDNMFLLFESDLWSKIRGNYFAEYCRQQGRKFLWLDEALETATISANHDVCIYVAKSHMDRKLEKPPVNQCWEKDIQVGTDFTDVRISETCDNQGENISYKNKRYCELTALYWMWKHATAEYVGLCHYRRRFCMDKNMINKLSNADIDVVVTIPIINVPNVETTYAVDHDKADWDIMMEGIKMLHPEYYESALQLSQGDFYFAYNMFIARNEIMKDYCEWLFSILNYCEQHIEEKEDKYQNRVIGFLGERLLSIYLLYHEGDYRIAISEKCFIEK